MCYLFMYLPRLKGKCRVKFAVGVSLRVGSKLVFRHKRFLFEKHRSLDQSGLRELRLLEKTADNRSVETTGDDDEPNADDEGELKTNDSHGNRPGTGDDDGSRPMTGDDDGSRPGTGDDDGSRPGTGNDDGSRPGTGDSRPGTGDDD